MIGSATLASHLKNQTGKDICIFEHRASWALLTFLLSTNGEFGRRVALPSFLCHAPVAALLEAGMLPFFCDVDPSTGNVPDSEWQRATESGVKIFLWVHMFGIPQESELMRQASTREKFLVIEDCCLAFGGKLGNNYCGSIGHAALFSFGATKQVNLGAGGAILFRNESILHSYKRVIDGGTKQGKFEESNYRKKFYEQVNAYVTQDNQDALVGLAEAYRPYLRNGLGTTVLEEFDHRKLEYAIHNRIHKHDIYEKLLSKLSWIKILKAPGMTPWRFVFRLPFTQLRHQHQFAALLRAKEIDVSTWYFPTHKMISSTADQHLLGTETLSTSIFQFWLDETIDAIGIPDNCSKLIDIWNQSHESFT